VLYSRPLLVIYFVYSTVYMSIPFSQFNPLSTCLLVAVSLFSNLRLCFCLADHGFHTLTPPARTTVPLSSPCHPSLHSSTLGTAFEDEPGQGGDGGRECFQLPDVFCLTCSLISILNAFHGTWTHRSTHSSFLPFIRSSSLIAVTCLTSEGI